MNRASIYDSLFTELINRSWAAEGQIDILKGIEKDDLRDFLRNIAFEMFQSKREYIHKSKLVNLKATNDFIGNLKAKDRIRDVLKNVMIAFYFQETKKDNSDDSEEEKNEYAIEFLHKSLKEYLVAEKIWEEIKVFTDKDARRGKFIIDSPLQGIEIINNLLGKNQLTFEISICLCEIIKNSDIELRQLISERFQLFIPAWLDYDFLHIPSLNIDNPWSKSYIVKDNFTLILVNLVNEKNYFNDIRLIEYFCDNSVSIHLKDQILKGRLKSPFILEKDFFLDVLLSNAKIIVPNSSTVYSDDCKFQIESIGIFSLNYYQEDPSWRLVINDCLMEYCEFYIRAYSSDDGYMCSFSSNNVIETKFKHGSYVFSDCRFEKCIFSADIDIKADNCVFKECVFYIYEGSSQDHLLGNIFTNCATIEIEPLREPF